MAQQFLQSASVKAGLAPRGAFAGPSTRLGVLGPGNTYGPGTPFGSAGAAFSGVGGTQVPAINRYGARRGFSPLPPSFDPARVGFSPLPLNVRYSMLRNTSVDMNTMELISGMAQVQDMNISPGWVPSFEPEALRTPLRSGIPQGSSYHRLIGVIPTVDDVVVSGAAAVSSEGEGGSEKKNQSSAERLENLVAVELILLTQEANKAFREVTQTDVENRYEKQARTLGLLSSLYSMDQRNTMPLLLSVHLLVERSQDVMAMRNLLEAVRREPTLFSDNPDIFSYFGDPELLRKQARQFMLRNPGGDPAMYILQAYFGWLLQDPARVNLAVNEGLKACVNHPQIYHLEMLRSAINAAHETR
jgi:hypothetical protein